MIPDETVPTADARAAMPAAVALDDAVANVAAASQLVLGIERSDLGLIAGGLADRLHQPARQDLYRRSYDLVGQARDLGALGATISGAGPTVLLWSFWQDTGAVVDGDEGGGARVGRGPPRPVQPAGRRRGRALTVAGLEKGGPMDADQLRSIQAPIKERYRDQPDEALVTLTANATLGEGVTCNVSTGQAIAAAGLHPATGGSGAELCSGDMLLEALAACAGVTMRSVATAISIPVEGRVTAEGDLDFRGTLGVDREAPVGFRAIRVRFDLDTDAEPEQVAKLIELTERYCVVLQTLAGTPELSVTVD